MLSNFRKNKKSDLSRRLLLHLGGILMVAVLVVLIIADVKMYQKKEKLNFQVENLKNKIGDIQNKNNSLKEGILKENDSQYIEKVAREELDLQKPGEKVFSFIVPQNQPQKVTSSNSNTGQSWLGWIGNSWNWIFGKK